ncbi:MAG: hypothetical protein JO082_15095 [Mycobacterium sp.]|nr:hypothetical protein [Mycobacterium sp.]MBV9723229.1 hypothetical protein [Mycobacterium sp.]
MDSVLHVDTAGVRAMAGRWQVLAGDLRSGGEPGRGVGLACQPSAAAVAAGHADVTAGTTVLAARLVAGAARVALADTRYAANEAHSTAALVGVADPVIVV